MTNVGPVCHIAPVTTIAPKGPLNIPAIPPPAQATLQSLQQTVNTLRQIINIIVGGTVINNYPGSISTKGQPGGSFIQTTQQTQTVRVYQNNDKTSQNYVDVEYVTGLHMDNNATKATWIYNAPPPSS